MSNSFQYGGVALVGLGGITRAHANGYKKFGIPLVAGYDVSPEGRRKFQEEYPSVTIYDDLEKMLADPRVEVVDLATPHKREMRQKPLEQIVAARKPVYIQKPLAMNYAEALEMVETLEKASIPAMVNQNMCFTPGGMALPKLLIDEKRIGEPFLAEMHLRMCFDIPYEHWFGRDPRWWTIGLTVHHLAVLQLVFGPPETVFAFAGADPKQPGVPLDGFGNAIMLYPSGLRMTMCSTGTYYGVNDFGHGGEPLWVQGPDGIIDWRPEQGITISMRADKDHEDQSKRRTQIETPGAWFPDAMAFGMAQFQQALAAKAEPLCSVQDNLYVMGVMEAIYRSSETKQAIKLSDIMGTRYNPNYGAGWNHGFRQWQKPTPIQ